MKEFDEIDYLGAFIEIVRGRFSVALDVGIELGDKAIDVELDMNEFIFFTYLSAQRRIECFERVVRELRDLLNADIELDEEEAKRCLSYKSFKVPMKLKAH